MRGFQLNIRDYDRKINNLYGYNKIFLSEFIRLNSLQTRFLIT